MKKWFGYFKSNFKLVWIKKVIKLNQSLIIFFQDDLRTFFWQIILKWLQMLLQLNFFLHFLHLFSNLVPNHKSVQLFDKTEFILRRESHLALVYCWSVSGWWLKRILDWLGFFKGVFIICRVNFDLCLKRFLLIFLIFYWGFNHLDLLKDFCQLWNVLIKKI